MKKLYRFLSKDKKTAIRAVVHTGPEDMKPRAVLQICHGMAEYIDRYDRFAEHLANRGFVVAGHDHLGHGGSVNDWGEYGYFSDDPDRTLILDMHQLRVN